MTFKYKSNGASEVLLCKDKESYPVIRMVYKANNTSEAMWLADKLQEAFNLGKAQSDLGISIDVQRYEIAKSQLAALTSVYWEVETANSYTTGDALIECHCETAVEYADALIKELNKGKNE